YVRKASGVRIPSSAQQLACRCLAIKLAQQATPTPTTLCGEHGPAIGSRSGWDLALFGEKERSSRCVDEVGLVGRGRLPFGGRLRLAEGVEIVEPQLCHAVEVHSIACRHDYRV